jgi:hypothetical protein
MNDMGGLLAGGALSVSGACGVGKHKDRFLRFGPPSHRSALPPDARRRARARAARRVLRTSTSAPNLRISVSSSRASA